MIYKMNFDVIERRTDPWVVGCGVGVSGGMSKSDGRRENGLENNDNEPRKRKKEESSLFFAAARFVREVGALGRANDDDVPKMRATVSRFPAQDGKGRVNFYHLLNFVLS